MQPVVRTPRRLAALAAATATGLALVAVPSGAAMAAPSAKACEKRANVTISALLECVSAAGVNEHLEAFQAIADANGDTRVAGLQGYEASVEYVTDVLEAAGLPRRQEAMRGSLGASSRAQSPSCELKPGAMPSGA